MQQEGLVALCAIESLAGRRLDGYQACRKATEAVKNNKEDGATEFFNAAQAARTMLRLDESERLFLESARRPPASYGNPHLMLALLYLDEGRIAESLGQLREAREYQQRRPAYLDQLLRAQLRSTLAIFFLAVGRPHDALTYTEKALSYPDRKGGTSSRMEEAIGGTALLDSVARQELAEQLAEEQAGYSFWDRLRAKAKRAMLLLQAWASARKAAVVLAQRKELVWTLDPTAAEGLQVPRWLVGELVRVLGAGVVEQAIKQIRPTLEVPRADAYLDGIEAEAALARGNAKKALALAERALSGLPPAETLVAARVLGVAAEAARRLGRRESELAFLGQVLEKDPTVVRRLGLSLPVEVQSDGTPVAREAVRLLDESPRFRRAPGMRLSVTGHGACVRTPQGAVIVCTNVIPGPSEDPKEVARRVVRDLHDRLFAPRVDLSQLDARSLDGSLAVGDTRAAARATSVLEAITKGQPQEGP